MKCPDCGYDPIIDDTFSWEPTDEDLLDCFEVCGCDEGHVMCPKCAWEFRVLGEEGQ